MSDVESPQIQMELEKILSLQKARGNGPDVEIPPVSFETSIEGKIVDAGKLPE